MQDTASDDTTDYLLSSAEALLAGTLALMTAMAQGCCDTHGELIRRKIVANLTEIERHPQLSQQFRAVASNLQQHWFRLAASGTDGAGADHVSPWPAPRSVH